MSRVSAMSSWSSDLGAGYTYRLVLISLHDSEISWVRGGLHDEPGDGLLVLTVDAAGLDQLGLELLYGRGIGIGAEVDGDCVNHGGLAGSDVGCLEAYGG